MPISPQDIYYISNKDLTPTSDVPYLALTQYPLISVVPDQTHASGIHLRIEGLLLDWKKGGELLQELSPQTMWMERS